MLNVKDRGNLIEILDYCKRIKVKIDGVDFDSFDSDLDLKDIISFNIFQVGELAKKLSNDFILEFNKVPWKQIKGMRDMIGHGYQKIDYEIIYNTAVDCISELKEYIQEILK